MIENIRKINNAIRISKIPLGRTISIRNVRKKSGLQYNNLKDTLLLMAKLQAIELLNGDPKGKTDKDMIKSNQKNIPYINLVYHVKPLEAEIMYFEYEIDKLKSEKAQLEKLYQKERSHIKKKEAQTVQQQQEIDRLNRLNKQLHTENIKLVNNSNKPETPEPIPDKIKISDSEIWGIQIKNISGREYIYAYKRFDKVYSLSLGREWPGMEKAISKIKAYKQKKKIFTNKKPNKDINLAKALEMLRTVAVSEGIEADIRVISMYDKKFISVEAGPGRWEFEIGESVKAAMTKAGKWLTSDNFKKLNKGRAAR